MTNVIRAHLPQLHHTDFNSPDKEEVPTPSPHGDLNFNTRLPIGSVDLNQIALIQSLARHEGATDLLLRQAKSELFELAGNDQEQPVDFVSMDPKQTTALNRLFLESLQPGERPKSLNIQGDGFCGWRSAMLSFLLTGEQNSMIDTLKRIGIDSQIIDRLDNAIPVAHSNFQNVLCKSSTEQSSVKLRYPYESSILEGQTQLELDLKVIVERFLVERGYDGYTVQQCLYHGAHATSDQLIDFGKFLGQPLVVFGATQREVYLPVGAYADNFKQRLKSSTSSPLPICSLQHNTEHFDLYLPKVLKAQAAYSLEDIDRPISDKKASLYRCSDRPVFVSCDNESSVRPLYRNSLHQDLRQTHQEFQLFSGQNGNAGWLISAWFAILQQADDEHISDVISGLNLSDAKKASLLSILESLSKTIKEDPLEVLAKENDANDRYHIAAPGTSLQLNQNQYTETEQQLVDITQLLFLNSEVVQKASNLDGAIFSGDTSNCTKQLFSQRCRLDRSYESFDIKFKQEHSFQQERMSRYKNAVSETDSVYSVGISSALMEIFEVGTHVECEQVGSAKGQHKIITSNTGSQDEFIEAFSPAIKSNNPFNDLSSEENSQPMLIKYLENKTVVSIKYNSGQNPTQEKWDQGAVGSFSAGKLLLPKSKGIDADMISKEVTKSNIKIPPHITELLKNASKELFLNEQALASLDRSNYLEDLQLSSYPYELSHIIYGYAVDIIKQSENIGESRYKLLPDLGMVLKLAGIEINKHPVLDRTIKSIEGLFELSKGNVPNLNEAQLNSLKNEIHGCFNNMALLKHQLNTLMESELDKGGCHHAKILIKELNEIKMDVRNKMYSLFYNIDDNKFNDFIDYFGKNDAYDSILYEMESLLSKDIARKMIANIDPVSLVQTEIFDLLGLSSFEYLNDLISHPLPVDKNDDMSTVSHNSYASSDALSDMENGILIESDDNKVKEDRFGAELGKSSELDDTMSMSYQSKSNSLDDRVGFEGIEPMDWEFIDDAPTLNLAISGSPDPEEVPSISQKINNRNPITLERFRQIIKDGWQYLFKRTSHLRANTRNEINPTAHIISSSQIRKAVVGANPTEIRQANAVLDHTKSDPVSHIFQFVSSNRFNDQKRRESTFYGMAEKVINQQASSLGESISQHQITSIEKIRSDNDAPIETIRVTYETSDPERGELKENTVYLTLAGYSLKEGRLSTDDIIESYKILRDISENVVQYDSDENFMFFSKGGIGRSAALMVLNEVMNIHRDNPISDLKELYATVNTVIEEGRSARGFKFIHNGPQYEALQEAAYRLIFE